MNQQEKIWLGLAIYDTFAGILANNQVLVEQGDNSPLMYDFLCPEYKVLIQKYHLLQIAKTGTSFEKSFRLMNYFAKRLKHESNYDNHISCNSLALLEYSLNQPEHGINCLNKAKILVECFLALGIYARRVSLMPYSPYDFDNHVVVEIFDENLQKWIMLDPTTNTYFVDINMNPLSCLEIRQYASQHEWITSFHPNQKLIEVSKLFNRNLENNYYIIKNMFYFYLDTYNGFGNRDDRKIISPLHFDITTKTLINLNYKIREYQKRKMSPLILQTLQTFKTKVELEALTISSVNIMNHSPYKNSD